MKTQLLGGLTPTRFLRDYWQKKPLLVRSAVPGFTGLLKKNALFSLAGRDDVESRLVRCESGKWLLEHGPFGRSDYRALPDSRWTLLVQGLNMLLPSADALLRRFAFIPYSRIDDVMLSYATPGGGVGPHVDSYDVFLLQGEGRRRWRISHQRDLSPDPRAPLKVLKSFRAEREWVLEPGDMLYLPPGVAHEGIALDTCTTYSIGFRAPAADELASGFLDYLHEHINLTGRYADPQLKPTRSPGEIPAAMVDDTLRTLSRIRWSRRDIEGFIGEYLSMPKSIVRFDRPAPCMTPARFAAATRQHGLKLDPRTLLLYRGGTFYINGDPLPAVGAERTLLRRLANMRGLPAGSGLQRGPAGLFYSWYCDGYIHVGESC